jgi:hypothetical protein
MLLGFDKQGDAMKAILSLVLILVLCSCADYPQMRTSVNYGGQVVPGSMTITDPHFYMDDERSDGAAVPGQGYTDSYCSSRCVGYGHSTAYCNRACGY